MNFSKTFEKVDKNALFIKYKDIIQIHRYITQNKSTDIEESWQADALSKIFTNKNNEA